MNRILACIDGSKYSKSCCQYAAWLAMRAGAAVRLVYVTDLRQFEVPFVADLGGSLGLQPYQAIMGELQNLEAKKAELVLQQGEAALREAGFEGAVDTVHKTGFLVDSMTELEESADIILLGKRGENANFATEHLGSTMERVVRAASKPCFVASRSFRQVSRVLVAYEDAASCRAAIEYVGRSGVFSGLDIHVVTVAQSEDEAKALADLKEAEDALRRHGFAPTCQMLHGMVSAAISAYADESKIDLLVMGAYGHSRIRRLFLGSTTTEMLRDCRLPTLLFR